MATLYLDPVLSSPFTKNSATLKSAPANETNVACDVDDVTTVAERT